MSWRDVKGKKKKIRVYITFKSRNVNILAEQILL